MGAIESTPIASSAPIWVQELASVAAEHREEEAELYQKRWFDYRHMLPGEATQVFMDDYIQIYLETYEKVRDIRTVDAINPLSEENIFRSGEMTALWLARQAADRVGCPYDFYLRHSFNRFCDRGWRYFPRPNQLYEDGLMLDIQDIWRERCNKILQLAKHERFDAENYVGHPDQIAYIGWLAEQVKARQNPEYVLCTLLFRRKLIPQNFATNLFSPELIEKAKAML